MTERAEDLDQLKIAAIMSIPRYGCNASRGLIERACSTFRIPLNAVTGAYWGQILQNAMELFEDEVDWIITFDYDTCLVPEQLSRFFKTFGDHPEMDALASLQCRRNHSTPLMSISGQHRTEINIADPQPIKADTANFGMTLLRVENLKRTPKPWFWSIPSKAGGWNERRPTKGLVHPAVAAVWELAPDVCGDGSTPVDADVWFWRVWAEAGNSLYVDPACRVGHLEEMITEFDANMEPATLYAGQWREKYLPEPVTRQVKETNPAKSVKLNIGAGPTRMPGWTPIDRKLGTEAYPLTDYADDSVDEIRASHVLEHFGFAEVPAVLNDWVRVLRPGCRIRISVPEMTRILRVAQQGDDLWAKYLMGGQTDENDYHKSVFTEAALRDAMEIAGLHDINEWHSDNTDTAGHKVSYNLEGYKPRKEQPGNASAIEPALEAASSR